ncbi:hypothetical protein OHD62_17435 [Mesorhizobium sp. YC-39]|uniref:hypothetical protein n=1 Tax=unclassified Mesorhizobium TaxID=325217 RepID=UPI0021E82A00|nr:MULTISPECIES: hypothetical protein [unclassified Mesorhizobium]MCV3209627.1 hypothetical protein [Mesorhizobium sp. YC-2]MCV3230157.1 hypothetical protein [Mesorhizobium sp. YC-39]
MNQRHDGLSCLACAKSIPEGTPTYPDVSGTLCAECAPTYAMLLEETEPCGFVNLDDESPLSADRRREIYDAHIAAGGKPSDSMARVD